MKRQTFYKRFLSVILSITLIVGVITISVPNQVNANATENLIANGVFDSTTNWTDNSDSANPVPVQEQQKVAVTVPNYVAYQDFETASEYTGKWRNQSTSTGTLEFVEETTGSDNHVLKYTATGGATFDFHNGDVQIFEKGKTYTLSYRYKADVSIHGYHAGIDSGWTTYDDWMATSTEWVSASYTFTPNDSLSSFQVGFQTTGAGIVYIDDFTISCGTTEKVTENVNTVFEADFEQDSDKSKVLASPGSWEITTADKLSGEKSLKIGYTSAWGQFGIGTFELKAGTTYTISYDWKITGYSQVDSAQNAYSRLVKPSNIYSGLVLSSFQTSETDWTTVTYTYTPSEDLTAAIYMEVGGGTGTIYLDNLSVSYTTTQTEYVYTEGIGNCLGAEPDNVLVMEKMTEVTYPVTITNGTTYEYSFVMKNDAMGSDFSFGFGAGENAIFSGTESVADWTVVSGTFTATADATSIKFTRTGTGKAFVDDVVLKESVIAQQENVEIYFDRFEGGWYFSVDDISKIEEGYYKVSMRIDGEATADVIIEYPKSWYPNGLAIWDFTNLGGTTPTTSIEIAENAVMTPININTLEIDTSRNAVMITNNLKVVKENDVWKEYEESAPEPIVYPTVELDFKFVEVDNSWYFTASNMSNITGNYYKMTVNVDETVLEVPVEKTADGFVIWSNFFGLIDTTGSVPSAKLEIPADTLLQQIDPNTMGWSTVVEDGQTLKVAEDLVVTKTEEGWKVEGEQGPIEPVEPVETITVSLGNAMGIYNAGTENEVFSANISSPEEAKTMNMTVTGLLNADGNDRESVIAFPCNGEIFFYLDGATEKLIINKDTEFLSGDGKTIVKFDKNYEIDLVNQVIYEQGNKPTEKEPLDLELAYDRLVGESFMFAWSMSTDSKPEASYYRIDAIIDGKETQVLIEYYPGDNAFFIYPNCFNGVPVESKEGYPVESFELKEGTELTPVVTGTWVKNISGQPYKLTKGISVVKEGTTWMDADYADEISKLEPMEVKVVFERVQNGAAVLTVITPDGKSIDSTYGDWTTAWGTILRGVLDAETKKCIYTSEKAAYSITGSTFYISGLRLNELEGLQIDKGTILYPDATCKSIQPIKIMNQFRIVRDANDEWEVDKTFTTDYNLTSSSNNASENAGTTDKTETVESVVQEEVEEIVSGEAENEDYSPTNIRYHEDDDVSQTDKTTSGDYTSWIIIASVSTLLVVLGIIILLALRRRKKEQQEEN